MKFSDDIFEEWIRNEATKRLKEIARSKIDEINETLMAGQIFLGENDRVASQNVNRLLGRRDVLLEILDLKCEDFDYESEADK